MLVVGSFYPLFSFLFGCGFALYLRKGNKALPLFRRRLILLLCIGFVHSVFIWSGDILVTYALVGFLLIPFRSRSAVALLGWIIVLTASTFFLVWFLGDLGAGFSRSYIEQVTQVYREGSYLEATVQRIADTSLTLLNLPFTAPQILAFFLGGLLVARQHRFENSGQHRSFWRWVCFVSLLIGVPFVALQAGFLLRPDPVPSFVSALDLTLGSPALGFGYSASLFLFLTPKVQRRLKTLALVGRMALTNYLAQSVVFTLIFYGYGGGWYGKSNPAWSVLWAFVVFAGQVGLSRWWLTRFRYGPAEWGWRCLTYGRWFELRK